MTEYAVMAYTGRDTCGCVVAVTVDEPKHRDHVAQMVAEWIRDGLIIERVTIEEARMSFTLCDHTAATDEQEGRE